MLKNLLLLFASTSLLLACQSSKKDQNVLTAETGAWLMKMRLDEAVLPFNFHLEEKSGDYLIRITNADEEILITEVNAFKDSIQFDMPVYESAFFLKVHNADSMSGKWVNYYKSDDYQIAVRAKRTDQARFGEMSNRKDSTPLLFSKYAVVFSPGQENSYQAIGLFEAEGETVKGTFATETGDYRYLEGRLVNDSLFLSTFDGSHAFYFAAKVKDSTLKGVFVSGIHHRELWEGINNPTFKLSNPDSLTSLVDSAEVNFELPNSEGQKVSLGDSVFENKVKIIQIMGSWCPNCLDESRYFNALHKKYSDSGLAIIGVAFERTRSENRALQNLSRLVAKENLHYPLLLGGYNRDHHPRKVFPMIDRIISYPTSLFLDKANKVRKIHTGFYGPGTGSYYKEYKAKTELFIESLLRED